MMNSLDISAKFNPLPERGAGDRSLDDFLVDMQVRRLVRRLDALGYALMLQPKPVA